jgi:hypothetical protein
MHQYGLFHMQIAIFFVSHAIIIDHYEPYTPTNVNLKGDCGEMATERRNRIASFALN